MMEKGLALLAALLLASCEPVTITPTESSITLSNAPTGNFAVILVADCDDDDNPVGRGDCFGIAGMSAAEALNILNNLNTTSLDDLPTYSLSENGIRTTAAIELGLIP